MVQNAYWGTELIGGGVGAADKIPTAYLVDKDTVFVPRLSDTQMYMYAVDDDLGGTESSPSLLKPDDESGNKRLTLIGLTLPNTGLHLLDSDASHDLIIKPGSDLTADREFTITTGDAARTLDMAENLTIGDGTDITLTGVTQANTLTLYESLTLGDGNSGTITFSAASKTVTVAGSCTLNDWFDQAVKVASTPTLGGLTIGSDGSGGDVLAYGGTASNSLKWDASENVLDIASTMKAADNVLDITVTDATTLSSGYGRGAYIGYTVSGSKSGAYAINGLGIDMTISEACPTVSALEIYTAAISNKTVGNLYPLSIYCEDIGTEVSNFMALDIGINSTNTASSRHTGIRIRNHSGTAKAAIMIEEAFTDTILRHSPSGVDLKLITLDNGSGGIFYWDDSETNFRFNKGLYIDGGIGVGIAGTADKGLFVRDSILEATAPYWGVSVDVVKTAGTTDTDDTLIGGRFVITLNQSGGIISHLRGLQGNANLTAGDIGDASNSRNVQALRYAANLDGGKVYGNVYGAEIRVDIETAVTEITEDVYGQYIYVDDDSDSGAGCTGTAYMLFLSEHNNIDYCIFQNGTAPSHFGGDVDVNVHDAATVGLKLGGTLVTASAAEINLLDGASYGANDSGGVGFRAVKVPNL